MKLIISIALLCVPIFGQGFGVFPPASGGVGVGAANVVATAAGPVTSLAIDITPLGLTSGTLNSTVVQCWTGTTTFTPLAITLTAKTATSVTANFSSSSNVICVVNSNGGAGATGATGATGAAGANGTNGNTILSGTSAPSGGANGDFYLRTDTSCLYGPKASGSWPGSCTSLIGPGGGGSGATIIRPSSASGSAYAATGVTGVSSMGSPTAPLLIQFIPDVASSSGATLNINSIGALPIMRNNNNVGAGELSANSIWPIACDGTVCAIQAEMFEAGVNTVIDRTAFPHTIDVRTSVFGLLAGANAWTGTQTLSLPLVFTQSATPAAPPASSNKLYTKSDNLLYLLNSAGVETAVGGGGGFTNPMSAADQFIGSGSSSTGVAGAIAFPNCANDGAHALVYSTSTHAMACSAISGGSGTTHDYIPGGTGDSGSNSCKFQGLGANRYGSSPDYSAICSIAQGASGMIQIIYNGVVPTLRMDVMASTAGTGNITLTGKSVCVSAGTTLSNTGFTAFSPSWNSGTPVDIAATGAYPVLLQGTLTFPTTGCTTGQLMFLSIFRSATDTYGANTVYIQGALPTY